MSTLRAWWVFHPIDCKINYYQLIKAKEVAPSLSGTSTSHGSHYSLARSADNMAIDDPIDLSINGNNVEPSTSLPPHLLWEMSQALKTRTQDCDYFWKLLRSIPYDFMHSKHSYRRESDHLRIYFETLKCSMIRIFQYKYLQEYV